MSARSKAEGGDTLIFRPTLSAAEDPVEAGAVGDLILKGFHRPIPAYNVLRLKG